MKKKPKEKKSDEKPMNDALREIEKNIFSLKFYPVAVDEDSKNEAIANLLKIYGKENETVKQLILFMLHESISQYFEFKIAHVFDYFRAKNPQEDPAKLRIEVYRKMFNYNTSLEGIMEIISLLGRIGGNDAAKLLTYHYARACVAETELHVSLRNAIISALGESDSPYALSSLLTYANHTDNERTFQRLMAAISKWNDKLDKVMMKDSTRKKLQKEVAEVIKKEFGTSHYG